jgi:hypothetical protein
MHRGSSESRPLLATVYADYMISTWTIDRNAYSLLVEEFMRQLGLVDITKAFTGEHPSLGLNTL